MTLSDSYIYIYVYIYKAYVVLYIYIYVYLYIYTIRTIDIQYHITYTVYMSARQYCSQSINAVRLECSDIRSSVTSYASFKLSRSPRVQYSVVSTAYFFGSQSVVTTYVRVGKILLYVLPCNVMRKA